MKVTRKKYIKHGAEFGNYVILDTHKNNLNYRRVAVEYSLGNFEALGSNMRV